MANIEPQEVAAKLTADLAALNPETISEQAIKAEIEQYIEKLITHQRSNQQVAARHLCMGLLLGLYRFDTEIVSKLDRLPSDAVQVIAEEMIFSWKAGASRDDMAAVIAFVDDQIGAWGSRLV